VAFFDKVIPPGAEGKITLKVDTTGYQGNITKKANVHSNDPNARIEILKISTFVKVPIHVSSRYVYLRALPGQTITKTVTIKAQKDKPLKLEVKHFDLKEEVVYNLEEVEAEKSFQIRFSNVPGPAKTYVGFLRLKTNYSEKPEISIRIRGRFKSAK